MTAPYRADARHEGARLPVAAALRRGRRGLQRLLARRATSPARSSTRTTGCPRTTRRSTTLGVSVEGKIVLVRYGGSFRGVKAQQAELRGAKGVIIYSDPADDGFKRGPVYPDGPWRPADGIQRGSIQYIFNYPGDPLTPGVPSVPGTRAASPRRPGRTTCRGSRPRRSPTARRSRCSSRSPARRRRRRSSGGLPITYRVGPGRDAGPARPRHRLRADAGVERDRHDPRHHEAGREGRHRRALRRLDLRHERQHQRLDRRHGGRAQPRQAARPRLAAGADDRARRLGRRGVRPARLDRVGRSSSRRTCAATPSPTRTSTAPAGPSSAPPACRSSTTRSSR